MDDFRLILILAGALGIGGLLWHGLWSLRKQQKGDIGKNKPLAELYKEQNRDDDGFDHLGVSKVRTLGDSPERQDPSFDTTDVLMDEKPEPSLTSSSDAEKSAPEQVEFALDVPEMPPEPKAKPEPEQVVAEPEQVLVLSVVAAPGDKLHGSELLPEVLTLGFKFGDMGIFHRHEESSGDGSVLFSMANMMKPGTFDVDNMELFQTQGVSLFLTLPNGGDAAQSFKMMLDAAQKLARELKGQVLDDTRSVLTNQKIRHYQERIREFERQKLLAH